MAAVKKSVQLFSLSTLSGLLLWLCWPAHGFTPLVFIAFVPLLFVNYYFLQNDVKRGRWKVFAHFYWCMLLWNSLTTWWIYNSTDVGSFVALGLNSLLMAMVWQLFHLTRRRSGLSLGYASLISFWIGFEYLHLHWEASWPWLTLGNVFASHPAYVQWYEFTGVLGGTLWILGINLFLFVVAKNMFMKELVSLLRGINSAVALTASAIFVIAPVLFSWWLYDRHVDKGTPVKVAIVQPNIDPYHEKFSGTGDDQLAKMLQLASTVIDSTTEFVVFPETALPDGMWEENLSKYRQIKTIEKFIHAFPRVTVVIGASTLKEYKNGQTVSETARKFTDSDGYYDAFNTALMIDQKDSVQIYHKTRLVPGVEKMPYTKIFGFLEKYSIALGGTSGSLGTQKERTVFVSPDGTRIAPAICYESIYGDFMSGYMRNGAQLIFVITNDGWWGNTPGYRQHENYARLLAIEFRKSIARSANTGVSCYINQRGDVMKHTDWWKEDAMSETILKNNIKTFYSRFGDYIGVIASGFSVLFLIMIPVRIIRKRKSVG